MSNDNGPKLPPEYAARCTDTDCTWKATTHVLKYRNELVEQHRGRYGHDVDTIEYP